jgi:DNA-binding GntR family transcriptional regulator
MEFLGLTESVIKYLRNNIITCTFEPGQKLNELGLASDLNISRAPLREAFCALENERLITRIPRKGTYVNEISIESLRELYSAREMIECYAIDLLKSRNVRDLPDLYASLTQASHLPLPQRHDQNEIVNWLRGLTDFHVKLVASTRNHWLITFYDSIVANLARYQYFCIWVPGLTQRSQEMHEQIFNLLATGAYDRAKKILVSHIESTIEFIANYISTEAVAQVI